MKHVFLILALVGAVAPYVFFSGHVRAEGFGIEPFLRAMFANGVSGGLTADLLLSSLVFWLWLAHERVRRAWLFVVLNLTIGLSCALPAYLYTRMRT